MTLLHVNGRKLNARLTWQRSALFKFWAYCRWNVETFMQYSLSKYSFVISNPINFDNENRLQNLFNSQYLSVNFSILHLSKISDADSLRDERKTFYILNDYTNK